MWPLLLTQGHFKHYKIKDFVTYSVAPNHLLDICHRNDTSIVKAIFDKNYVKKECTQLKKKDFVNDGLVDSCRQLLNQYDGYNKYS